MREKQLKLIVTFHTTTSAMAMEKVCMANGVAGRLIPVPRDITASCGMSWCAPLDARLDVESITQSENIETDGWFEILV